MQSAALGAPAIYGRRRNPEIGTYFDGTVVNMSKNYDEMMQRAGGLQEHVAGGVSATVVYSGHRDKAVEYSPPHRQTRSDAELFPMAQVNRLIGCVWHCVDER